jgi:uncharacterized protein (UPF0276 family)
MPSFLQRVRQLPALGIGISTEYGASTTAEALDIFALRATHAAFARFLEIGVEVVKGLDATAQRWVQCGLPTTYHFLDVNLDEAEDFDAPWQAAMAHLVEHMQPAWLCGDAGLWHFGRRERGHMLLLPPILSREAARAQAEARALRAGLDERCCQRTPRQVYLGNLHILEFFAEVMEQADTGMLLDCAHLAMYQRLLGYAPCTALEGFPLERIVELHVAGTTPRTHDGFVYWDDDHTPQVLEHTWEIFDWVAPRAPNLKAVVFECERNALDVVIAGFQRIAATLPHGTGPCVAAEAERRSAAMLQRGWCAYARSRLLRPRSYDPPVL